MSNIVSPAQALPSNILRQVIQYAHAPTKDNGNNVQGELVDKVMLSVCSSWRLAALDHVWSVLKFYIGNRGNRVFLEEARWAKHFELSGSAAGHIRAVILSISLKSILNGVAYKVLSEFTGDTTFLPAANRLCIWVNTADTDIAIPESSGINNVLEFTQLLKSMTPAKKRTELCFMGKPENLSGHDEQCFGILMSSLCSRSKNISLSFGDVKFKHSSTFDSITQLSSISVSCKNASDLNASLVHRCAETLIDLHILLCSAKTLFYDAKDNIVVYPYLKKLKLDAAIDDVPIERASVPNVVTLPLLEGLNIGAPYPYTDDVLFRGNSVTFRCLHITIDEDAIGALNSTRTLSDKHKNLKVVVSDYSNNYQLASEASRNIFIGTIAGAAKSLVLNSVMPANYLIAAAPPTRGFESLQGINTSWTPSTLFDMLCLLKVLPNLVNIYCNLYRLGSELDDLATEELPDYIAPTYSTTGKKLQIISLFWAHDPLSHTLLECVLLLALACPKLCRVEIMPRIISEFQTNLAEAIEKEPYVKYASQLNRLLNAVY